VAYPSRSLISVDLKLPRSSMISCGGKKDDLLDLPDTVYVQRA